MIKDKFLFICFVFLLLLFGILFSQKIGLSSADLGRHIKNGEMILSGQGGNVLRENFYSDTFSGYPFLNHHWGSGVVFFVVQKLFGWTGLSIFFVILSLLTFYLFFDTAKKKAGFETAFLTSLLLLPVITYRTEIRPEVFSYLFSGIFLWILWNKKEKLYLWLPFLAIVWINLHVYFFLGLFLTGVFLLKEIIDGNKKTAIRLGTVLIVSVLVSLLNPAGINGLLYPLNIFKEYGYRVLENQTVLFIDKVLVNYPPNLFFKIGFGVLILSWVVALKNKHISFINVVLTIMISYLGWTALRNFTIFGFFALPVVCENFSLKRRGLARLIFDEHLKNLFLTISLSISVIFGYFVINSQYWLTKNIGWGVRKNVFGASDFFKNNNLKGPVFNNYDIGGYLIYSLYPREKVFVDNRPEAYPADFFTQTYVPMQEQKEKWEQEDKKYNFNVIFFYRRDLTPWAQTFLIQRVQDKNWAPIFADEENIIFLKRNEKNSGLIKKFELPKEIFTIR